MKYVMIGIMALLLMGSVTAMAMPKESICLTCKTVEPIVEPVVVVVDEPRSNNNNRRMNECNFDVERPRCLMNVWDRDKKIILNDEEISIVYDYRKSKNSFKIGSTTYDMERHGAFLEGEFEIDGRTFELSKASSWRLRIKEI